MRPLPELRLRFKKAFMHYYLEVCSASVATPTEAYETCAGFLEAWSREPGGSRTHRELDEELARLEGEIEQDLRSRYREKAPGCLERESLHLRFDECVRAALGAGRR